jgi:hypothetical protein
MGTEMIVGMADLVVAAVGERMEPVMAAAVIAAVKTGREREEGRIER